MNKREIAGIELGEDEEIKIEVERHPLGLLSIMLGAIVTVVVIVAVWIFILLSESEILPLKDETKSLVSLVAVALLILTLVISWVGITIYKNNILAITNKKVIQQTSVSLFDKSVQTIDLPAIEDVSFKKRGILQSVLDYGSIRLSTVGDETTYRFNFVRDPEGQVRIISNIVHAAKEKSHKHHEK
ncbi:MAG: hypothetical protein LBE03_01570 [Candidatus Nomurabacteria bacterium]|jgi:hypothetical protein|nr:hypothetical protein [Candidatus Nomurabacteria bacterium]